MYINQSFHITYCTNIHPGFDWQTTFESIKEHVPKIKQQVSKNEQFGLGLRLSNKASEELGLDENLAEFQKWLLENEVYVFTMNGFPYGNFHDERVKDRVHAPDWTTKNRVTYTKRLFNQLAFLVPEGISGGISTSPISYKHWHTTDELKHKALSVGAEHLAEIVLHLYAIEADTGKYLHLDIEPEPDGMLENSDEVLHFFSEYLLPIASSVLAHTLGKDKEEASKIIHRYITICYDICHFSLAYEEPEDTFRKFETAGIKIGKIQVSAALKILSKASGNAEIWETLALFDEPTYLHQVTEIIDDKVKTYNDLPLVLENKNDFTELRAHFHVPIFMKQFGELYSTQDHIIKVIHYLKKRSVSEHLEIETYTWDVLPSALKKDLTESITREINWLTNKMREA